MQGSRKPNLHTGHLPASASALKVPVTVFAARGSGSHSVYAHSHKLTLPHVSHIQCIQSLTGTCTHTLAHAFLHTHITLSLTYALTLSNTLAHTSAQSPEPVGGGLSGKEGQHLVSLALR